jgi:DNA modification methylase
VAAVEPRTGHPTQKPVELFARPIRAHTLPGDVVLEPFAGSGSQIIAAEQTGRRCFAVEQDPAYVDLAVARWETFTGRDAEVFRA